ncbi:MAG: transcription-repair coupling factor [Candidatus Omnitrophica bacterium CG07_land_8_20_14_0_80_42_15]|uniref:Transcription-repair-coupling factor n=1 Tax=Candidatus Aquitaenariimonas noxiae TaxID=1974741 RepID=A0A2J0KUT5_9BACT|nr:MAG: transcription-repair coupling factor [Candidatus Omnitrophica bacterium CG07_land_8_20_14_0_80_42_15]
MFESIKIYKNQSLILEELFGELLDYGYRRVAKVEEEGDFAVKGDVIEIFPLTFIEPARLELYNNVVERIKSYELLTGKSFDEHNVLLILPIKGIRPRKIKKKPLEILGEVPIETFVDIEPGDYVVHVDHGIGIYRGIKKLKREKRFEDHFVIEYDNDEKLYVPSEDLHLIQKYVVFEKRHPRLYKLGGKKWQSTKEKVKKGIGNFAVDLLEVEAKRKFRHGFTFSKDSDWQKELEEAFPYDDTLDQLKSTQDVKRDMESPKPMDRLLCGDVGYGKTEIALRAAFKAAMDNRQAAILVPTTILAEQHFTTFSERLKKYPVRVEMLSRFKTEKEQDEVIKGLRNGSVDIIIGTHRLLSRDVEFKNLGLVIIDEEQRFGVEAKEKLKHLRTLVDILTLTATPIPRTLYMSLMGVKDISVINTPPQDRLPIETHVIEYDDDIIKDAVRYELKRKGQVYFVNNRVKGIEKIAEKLKALVKEARIEVAHGQMKEKELERIMLNFIKGEIDCLVCTTIVQSGIDIPNANTIIINRADRFGLADLYQLRGRVGRYKNKAFAYFIVPKKVALTSDAQRRLDTVKKIKELGAGFKIAMEDLQIRGAGNILGKEQHGYITAVGFDFYCRLLKSAVGSFGHGRKTL